VHGFGNSAGDFNLFIDTLAPAANDDCVSATELEIGVVDAGSTFAASFVEDLPLCGE
jgi:hypothetical protein